MSRTRADEGHRNEISFKPPGNPHAGGNGRKNILRALDGSLRPIEDRLRGRLHPPRWDRVTPVEEVMTTLNDLVRSGKVRHIGFSNVPAWYACGQPRRSLTNADTNDLRCFNSILARIAQSRTRTPAARDGNRHFAFARGVRSPAFSHWKNSRVDGDCRFRGVLITRARESTLEKFSKRERIGNSRRASGVGKQIGKTPPSCTAWVIGRPR